MFEENKNLVTEEVAENVEQPTEEVVGAETTEQSDVGVASEEKLYTEAEFNKKLDEVLAKKIARKEARIKKEYENKYSKVETVLNAGLGTKSLDEATDKLTDFYTQKGVKIPQEPVYSERDLSLLAKAEADDIIQAGYDELVEEVDRLAELGIDNMNAREKLVFKRLAEERKLQESTIELSKLGVGKELLDDNDFKSFANKLNPDLSLTEKYEMYTKFNPKAKVKPIGSMKGDTSKQNEVKEFYTREEALQFTKKDFDKNPALYEAVERSMLKW
jgi:hypothetical protein